MSHRWFRLCVVLALLVPGIVFSQVTVRERVELKRQISPPRLQSASGDSSFLVRAEWDVKYDDPYQVQLWVCESWGIDPCGIDYTVIEQGHQYRVYRVAYVTHGSYVVGIGHTGWPGPVHVTVRVFKAGEPETTFLLTLPPWNGYGQPPYELLFLGVGEHPSFTTPFERWFDLWMNNEEIFPGDHNFFRVTVRTDTCTSIQWYPTADSVTLTITAGSELGQFVSPEGVPSGSSVTRLASEIPFVEFVADAGSSAGGVVTVQASSKGIIGTATFRVVPFLGKTLKLEAVPPIIPFGQNGGFGVQVLDEAGEPVLIPDNMTLKYEILEGAQWGVLFDYFTGQTGTVVEGAPWGIDLFTADTAAYEDKRVVVRVSSSSVGLTPDTAEILILPGLLKVSVTPTTLHYGQSAEIVAEGLYQDGELVMLDPSVLYSYEIVQAADAGYLVVGTDITRRDLIPDVGPTARFVAEEEVPQPASVQVTIKVTAKQEVFERKLDTTRTKPVPPPVAAPVLKKRMARTQDLEEIGVGVARVVVEKSACVRVIFMPAVLTPGDTAVLKFDKENPDGTFSEFPPGQAFDVMIVGGGDNAGTLVSSTGDGPVLTGTLAPVSYIAPAAIEGDSLIVQVAAFTHGAGAGSTPLGNAKEMPLFKVVTGQVTARALTKKSQDSVMVLLGKLLASSECVPGEALIQKTTLEDCDNARDLQTPARKNDKDGKGCDDSSEPASVSGFDDDLTFDIQGCIDPVSKRPRVKPTFAYFPLYYGICEKNIKEYLMTLMNIRDITPGDTATACAMKYDLTQRWKDRRQGLGGYWQNTFVTEGELITHEEAHLKRFREIAELVYAKMLQSKAYLISECEAMSIKNDPKKKREWIQRLEEDAIRLLDQESKKSECDDEKDANLRQGETLRVMINDLQRSYATCK
jgi:hypothetical protein